MSSQPSLHSRYDPAAEAERYLNALNLQEGTRFFILMEPGDGYLIPLLRNHFPEAVIIALHVNNAFAARDGCREWSPECGLLQSFLEREIPDVEASCIRIIEWRPACAVFGTQYLHLLAETVDFVKRIDANARTTKAFGRRWFRNFFKNISLLHKVYRDFHTSLPIIVAGAGPSLEESLPKIRQFQNDSVIISVSAAGPALLHAGIVPDLIVATDGGNWALFHLYECIRVTNNTTGIAMTMNAALPSQSANFSCVPVTDGSTWQNTIMQRLQIPFVSLPQRGTVTASAIDLAFKSTDRVVGIAGLDLDNRDIQSHTRPYSLDRFAEEQSSRCNPFYNQQFVRSRAMSGGGSYDIYAVWFKKHLPSYPPQLRTIGSNNPVFKHIPLWNESPTAGKKFLRWDTLPVSPRVEDALFILNTILSDPFTALPVAKELTALLIPESPDIEPEKVQRIVKIMFT